MNRSIPNSPPITTLAKSVRRLTGWRTCTVAVLLSWGSLAATAQSTNLEQIKQAELQALAQGAAAQQQVEALDDERSRLANEYHGTLKQVSRVNTYNQQLRDTTRQQQAEMELLNDQIDRIGSLEQDIVPLMVDMLDALENFIALDVPFLLEDRLARVQRLRDLMSENKVSNSEKYRRILEAYQIENDYGRTIEAYDRNLDDDGAKSEQNVTFLKIGRLAFFYQTLDGQQTFRWSSNHHTWERVANGDNRAVQTAIAMAKERIPSDLLLIPIEMPMNDSPSAAGGSF